MKPIVLDIETSGIDRIKCGIWQIGAYDLNTGEEFLEEGRIDNEDQVINLGDKPVLEVIGKTEEELREPRKQSQKELIEKFFRWCEGRKLLNFLCQNPQFDTSFMEIKALKYGLKIPFHHRAFDLHSIAQKSYHDLHKKFLIKDTHSDMSLKNILEFCGMEDNRRAHNALEDSKLTAECFSRIIYGKGIFKEYSEYEIPEELKK